MAPSPAESPRADPIRPAARSGTSPLPAANLAEGLPPLKPVRVAPLPLTKSLASMMLGGEASEDAVSQTDAQRRRHLQATKSGLEVPLPPPLLASTHCLPAEVESL